MYRSKEEREEAWRRKGGKDDKATWFRKAGASTVMTVPATKESRLAGLVREALQSAPDPTGCKTMVREQPGPSVRQCLVRSNPLPRRSCGRPLCPWLRKGEECKMRCFQEGVGYLAYCTRCHDAQLEEGKEEGDVVEEVYLGETSRSLVSRIREHVSDYKAAMKKRKHPKETTAGEAESSSWMADHIWSKHGGVQGPSPEDDFQFLVVGSWSKPLHRQLEEAIRIRNAMNKGFLTLGRESKRRKMLVNKNILNRKLENFSPSFLTLGGGDGEERE